MRRKILDSPARRTPRIRRSDMARLGLRSKVAAWSTCVVLFRQYGRRADDLRACENAKACRCCRARDCCPTTGDR